MASILVIVLYFYLHACAARPLKHIQLSTKEVAHRIVKHSDHDTNFLQMDGQKLYSVNEAQDIDAGKKVTISPYSWKILQHASGTETWKKEGRSTLESSSPPSENVHNDTLEDIDVMDYAQPHRKPPIHNRGT